MNNDVREEWRRKLVQVRRIPLLERIPAYVSALSSGDRVIAYVLLAFVGVASLVSLYALEQSLLIEVPAYGGTIVEGEVGNPQFINPLLAISDADRDLATLTYAGLMGLSGTGALEPVLAESYTMSPDGKTYTFTLREGAKFTDGTPVTATDVVFTVKKAQDPALKSPEYANWSGVQVVAVDAQTVRFTLTKPYAPFLGLTTLGILPSRLWQNVGDAEFPFSALQTSPVGNGPFKVASVSRDASGLIRSVSLVKNPYFVLGRPYLDGLQFNFYSNAEDLARAKKSGAIESAYGLSSDTTLAAPYARVFGIFFNPSDKQVYSRLEVRKALSLAIDRDAVISSALGGYATPLLGPVPPGEGVKQVPIPKSEDTTAAAASILESAGWSYDADARVWKNVKAKQSLEAITIRTSNVPELKNVASAVKTDWESLGIPVDIELYEPGDLSQNVIRPRKYSALLYGMVIGRDQDLYAFWDSQERNDPGLNIALYANKNVDALLEHARSTADTESRIADLQKIENIVAADYPAAFIYAPNFIYAVPEDLHGVALPQIITPADRFATVASWYRRTDSVWPFFARKNQ
ncbi:MAG: peptide ABC transporter substrate-binding protein [Candidatus Paceibacterota bacterium]